MDVFKVLLLILTVSSSVLTNDTVAKGNEAPDAGIVYPGDEAQPAWFKASFLDIREDVAEAEEYNKRLILYFYQDGCPYCNKLLRDNFGQREIAFKTRKYFDVVAINIWGDREVTDFHGNETTEKQFARDLKVRFTPTLLLLDESGFPVVRINGYFPPHKFVAAVEYVGLKQEGETSFSNYLGKLAPEPASGRLHDKPHYIKPPYRLKEVINNSGKPLLVLFEQSQCAACDELHLHTLAREESKELIERFEVVLLDIWSKAPVQTPDGKQTNVSTWAKMLAVNYAPSMLFFNEGGEEVFRVEAYLKSFHVLAVLDYVASGAYLQEPEFQRFIKARADALRAKGYKVNLMD